ncbi:hypothetical protein [Paraburkholderia sp. J7]|uniref:hypothetical protein n=1 Tax=Paraburkholderia sp. J7 TaxID=2805438 RepID=UPI002AB6375F|nr:hypothetical protein [Paraburkholderia sp. J7]
MKAISVYICSLVLVFSNFWINNAASAQFGETHTSGGDAVEVDDGVSIPVVPCTVRYVQAHSVHHPDLTMPITCYLITSDSQRDGISKVFGGIYDHTKMRWVPHYFDDDASLLAAGSAIYQISNGKINGFARTANEVTGDYYKRVKFFDFCLFSSDKAICGHSEIMKVSDPKPNELSRALKALRGVIYIGPKLPSSTD